MRLNVITIAIYVLRWVWMILAVFHNIFKWLAILLTQTLLRLIATYLTNAQSRLFSCLFRLHKTNTIKTSSPFCWRGCSISKTLNLRLEFSRFQSQMGNENFQRCLSLHFSVHSDFCRDRISIRYDLWLPTTFHLIIHFSSSINCTYSEILQAS
jgi:hypothetical protein